MHPAGNGTLYITYRPALQFFSSPSLRCTPLGDGTVYKIQSRIKFFCTIIWLFWPSIRSNAFVPQIALFLYRLFYNESLSSVILSTACQLWFERLVHALLNRRILLLSRRSFASLQSRLFYRSSSIAFIYVCIYMRRFVLIAIAMHLHFRNGASSHLRRTFLPRIALL